MLVAAEGWPLICPSDSDDLSATKVRAVKGARMKVLVTDGAGDGGRLCLVHEAKEGLC